MSGHKTCDKCARKTLYYLFGSVRSQTCSKNTDERIILSSSQASTVGGFNMSNKHSDSNVSVRFFYHLNIVVYIFITSTSSFQSFHGRIHHHRREKTTAPASKSSWQHPHVASENGLVSRGVDQPKHPGVGWLVSEVYDPSYMLLH